MVYSPSVYFGKASSINSKDITFFRVQPSNFVVSKVYRWYSTISSKNRVLPPYYYSSIEWTFSSRTWIS